MPERNQRVIAGIAVGVITLALSAVMVGAFHSVSKSLTPPCVSGRVYLPEREADLALDTALLCNVYPYGRYGRAPAPPQADESGARFVECTCP